MDKKRAATALTMMIMKLLQNKAMYGYQIIKELENRSENFFQLKEGTLYPILHDLENKNYVKSFEECSETGRVRKYYQLTDAGAGLLHDLEGEWMYYCKAVALVLGD